MIRLPWFFGWLLLIGCGGITTALRLCAGAEIVHPFSSAAVLAASPAGNPASRREVGTSPWLKGEAIRWVPGVKGEVLRLAGDAPWGQASHLVMDVYYEADHCGMLQLRFHVPGEESPRLSASLSLFPRLPTRLAFPLAYLDAQRVFLERTPGRLKGVISGRRLAPSDIAAVSLALEDVGGPQSIEIARLALVQGEPESLVPDRKLVDELGQWTERDWPGKTVDAVTLCRQLQAEHLAMRSRTFPEGRSRFGGWQAKRWQATGYFRVHQDSGRWWLVDPEGCAFFSTGLDCVRTGEGVAVLPGTEPWFAWLPPEEGEFREAVSRRRTTLMVDFPRANLIRAFGADWKARWRELSLGRLKAWGFNTVANWSELEALRPLDVPYVFQLGAYPSTKTMLYRDFPDVFAEEFRESARRFAGGLKDVREDPWLIGYFLRNEPLWGFGKNNLAAEMLEANPGTATRRELAQWLSRKYAADAGAWAKAWGREFRSFDPLVSEVIRRAAESSPAAAEDLWAFSREMVRAYVRVACEEVRKVDPHHLNLGMRYAWISSDLLYDAGELFDVFSINNYRMEPDSQVIDTIVRRTGKPVMIGEYHFGALDRGLPATGLKGVASQAERGVAYRRYLESAAAHPGLVGVHYFTLNDQGLLGRFDGENYQIGFVDVCHTPYAEIVDAAQVAHGGLYEVMSGVRPPYAQRAREVPAIR